VAAEAAKEMQSGVLWGPMLIAQPPITELTVSVACCQFGLGRPPASLARQSIVSLRSAKGLTIGEIISAAEVLIKAHAQCVNADWL
jgi:hypothetical protein